MKNFYFLLLASLFLSTQSIAQSRFYSMPVSVVDTYLEDSIHVLGRFDLDFPVNGTVFVQFDGEGHGTPTDRIILAANNIPSWDSNDGSTSFMSIIPGEVHCFSHTRTFSVEAGQHSYYATAHNAVDAEGEGIATVYGTFSVEFVPASSAIIATSSITVDDFDATTPVAYDSITVETDGPGKMEVRLNGGASCWAGDVIVVAVTDSKNWNYAVPGGIALESNITYYPYDVFSDTRVFNIPGAGTYTYYAMAHRGYEEDADGVYYPYTNLHARFYPSASVNKVESKEIISNNLTLATGLHLLDSIQLEIAYPGQVEIRFDGGLKSSVGHSILLAANNQPSYELEAGSVILQSKDEENDRHTFVHTRVFDVSPGAHTFYIMAENYLGSGLATIDLSGNFLVKYYPENVVSTQRDVADLPFEVWPNPAQDQISIQFENANDFVDISILDLQGHIVSQERNMVSGAELETSTLPAGIYLVQVSNGKEIGYKKLVKN